MMGKGRWRCRVQAAAAAAAALAIGMRRAQTDVCGAKVGGEWVGGGRGICNIRLGDCPSRGREDGGTSGGWTFREELLRVHETSETIEEYCHFEQFISTSDLTSAPEPTGTAT